MNPDHLTSEEASAFAAHKAKSAQYAVELAREVQLAEAIQKTAKETKAALLEGLKEVFGDGDEHNPNQMKVLVRRIPILCQDIKAMHEEIAGTNSTLEALKRDLTANTRSTDKINDNLNRAVWLVLSAVIIALLGTVLIP